MQLPYGIDVTGDLPLGDLLVALGTGALAFYTWQLAKQTRRDVALTRRGIEAVDMPFVIPTPIPTPNAPSHIIFNRGGPDESDGTTAPRLRLWNLGQGPAIVTNVRMVIDGRDVLAPLGNDLPVAREQVHDLEMIPAFIFFDQDAINPFEDVVRQGELIVAYSHASGTRYQTTATIELRAGFVIVLDMARSEAP